MKVKDLDVVRLKDGREAVILETYDNGNAFYAELQKKDSDPDLDFIKLQDIEEVIYVAK